MAASMTGEPPDRANILLVDDQPARLLTYEAILGSLGQNLVRASSGEEALLKLLEMEFAAVLLDVNMPGMSGFETAALLRRHPVCGKTPIIFVTGVHITDLDRLRGYEMGAADYVYVPVVPEILRGKVQVLVELYQQRRALAKLNDELRRAHTQLEAAHAELQAEKRLELQRLNSNLELSNAQLLSEVAERKRAESMLQEAARRKDEFISILAHELRNPLAAMQSGIEILRRPALSEKRLEWSRDLLHRQVRHLTRLIDDLLDVSRITTGRVRLQREVLELQGVLRDALEGVRPLIEARSQRVSVAVPPDPLYVDADPVRLAQIFGNLLTNAAKYSADEAAIDVAVEAESEPRRWITVSVRDGGAGIPTEMLEKIFELFAQADNAGVRGRHEGLGIGLALVRALTELHGGSVHARSDGPGSGSEFVVRLPALDAAALGANRRDLAREGHSAAEPRNSPADCVDLPAALACEAKCPAVQGLKVLIVDDNVDWARGLAIHLSETSKHDVAVEHTGERGVDAAVARAPDAVLLDIGLPDIDGYEVARRLKTQLGTSAPPVIGVSGYGARADRARAEAVGFARYFVKPVPYEVIDDALAELAAGAWRDLQAASASDAGLARDTNPQSRGRPPADP
jgi:signal transduction histidine kinase